MQGARGWVGWVMGLWLVLTWATAAAVQPLAVAGRLGLPAVPSSPLPLQGEWGFAWQRFVDPRWESLPTTAIAPVPASWNELAADGKRAGPEGFGSYLLQVDC